MESLKSIDKTTQKQNNKLSSLRDLNNKGLLSANEFDIHFKHLSHKTFTTNLNKVIDNELMKSNRYLFIKRINNKVYAICSHCSTRTELNKVPKNRSEHICKGCKSVLEVRNVKYASHSDRTYNEFLYFANSSLDKNIIVAYFFQVIRKIGGEFSLENNSITVNDEIKVGARYYFDIHSPCRMQWWLYWSNKWENTRSMYKPNTNNYIGFYEKSLLEALKKSEDFKYVSEKMILKSNPITLLEFYCKHPNIEKLEKIGLEILLIDKSLNQKTYAAVNWNGKTVQKMLKLNKQEIKFFTEHTNKSFYALHVMQKLKKYRLNLLEEYEHAYELCGKLQISNDESTTFDELISIDKPSRINKYLKVQCKKFKNRYRWLNSSLQDFLDMISDMKKLDMPTSKSKIYPKDLDKRHQDIAAMISIQGDKLRNDIICRRASELNKYRVETNAYIIFPARSVEDLIEESKVLGHCVQTYANKYVDGKTNIFVLRKKSNPEKPLYTIEVTKKLKVKQCRGKSNCSIGDKELEAKSALLEFEMKLSGKNRRLQHERIAN